MEKYNMHINRKQFIKTTASVVAGATLLPRIVFGSNGKRKLNIALIGVGGRGKVHVNDLVSKSDEVNMVAFADVDKVRSKEMAESFPHIPLFNDFRDMIAKYKGAIDGVVVSTPDHTHHYITKYCLKEGLPVFLEKPLAHTMWETNDLMAMEKKTGLACQMGNQGHSRYSPYLVKRWLDAGIIGEVNEVHVFSDHNNFKPFHTLAPRQAVPETLDWDLWLGPASYVDYNGQYCPGGWRCWNRFGEGTLGDMGTHCMDVPYYSLGLNYPSEVIPESSRPIYKESFPQSVKVEYRFPKSITGGPVSLTWYHGPDFRMPRPSNLEANRRVGTRHGGSYMVGSKETVMAGSHGTPMMIAPEVKRRAQMDNLEAIMKQWEKEEGEDLIKRSYNGDHMSNWLNAIRGKGKCRSNFQYGGRLTHLTHLGNIAVSLNTKLKVNPDTGDIIGNPQATALAQGVTPRSGWRI